MSCPALSFYDPKVCYFLNYLHEVLLFDLSSESNNMSIFCLQFNFISIEYLYLFFFFQFLTLQKGEAQLPIHRSQSVPVINKDGSIYLSGVIRVIPTTPQMPERAVTTTSSTSPVTDTGKFCVLIVFFHIHKKNLSYPCGSTSCLYFQILATLTCDNQPMPYLSLAVQMEVMMAVKILL